MIELTKIIIWCFGITFLGMVLGFFVLKLVSRSEKN